MSILLFARLRSPVRRENGECERSQRQKEAGLPSQCKTAKKKRSWGRQSEFWVGAGAAVPGEGGLELGFPSMGYRKWNLRNGTFEKLMNVPAHHNPLNSRLAENLLLHLQSQWLTRPTVILRAPSFYS